MVTPDDVLSKWRHWAGEPKRIHTKLNMGDCKVLLPEEQPKALVWPVNWLAGKQLCWERPCGSGGQPTLSHQCTLMAIKARALVAGWGRWSFLYSWHWWGCIWSAVSCSGLPSTKKIETYWRKSSTRLCMRKLELFQLEKEKTWGEILQLHINA